MNKIINRYIILGFLKTIFNVILAVVCLGIILNLFEEIEFFKKLNEGIALPFLLKLTLKEPNSQPYYKIITIYNFYFIYGLFDNY